MWTGGLKRLAMVLLLSSNVGCRYVMMKDFDHFELFKMTPLLMMQ